MIPGTFAAVFIALYVAHQVADHWVQTDYQAATKGAPGRRGWLANLAHVTTYTATAAGAVAVVVWQLGLDLDPARIVLGLAFSAITHSWADRRHTLAWLARILGSADFYRLGALRPGHDDNPSLGTSSYQLDQSFHIAALFIAALLTVG